MSRVRQVHQLLPVFTPGDAMGQAALSWQRALRHLGFSGQLFAGEVAPSVRSLVTLASRFDPHPDDLVLYHHGIASHLVGELLHAPCRMGTVFHNITPPRFYAGTRLEHGLIAGRAQLAALAEVSCLSIGVSQYNAAELTEAGHRHVRVVPLHVDPERLASDKADQALLGRLSGGTRPLVLSVSRVVAHKRTEDLLALHAELRRIAPEARLLIVGGYDAGHAWFKALERRAREIGQVSFLGRVNHAALVAAYRSADVFVSMSEHEGFGVPLVEAMACDVPVLAFGAAAVPETLGGRGVMFDAKNFAALAETVKVLTTDQQLRESVIAGQRQRVNELSFDATVRALGAAVKSIEPPDSPRRERRSGKPRVAIVVQRYGEQLTGGAEAHARQVAQRLAPHASVEVLTTCAADHLTWRNELAAGPSRDGRVRVSRFTVEAPRHMRAFNALSRQVFGRSLDEVAEQHWLAEQGPRVPGLLEALSTRRAEWDCVIFFTYLYAPTAWGVPLVADKALVVPTTHDEPPLQMQAFDDVFQCPRALLVNTPEERELIEKRYEAPSRRRVVGVGLDVPPQLDLAGFRQRYSVSGDYVLYLGRLEAGKGVDQLVRLHAQAARKSAEVPELLLAGAGDLRVSGRRVRALGRLSEADKWAALAGAQATVIPSRYESLSLIAVESLAVGSPILVNRESTVLMGHVQRSGAGAAFDDLASYLEGLQLLAARRAAWSRKAKAYGARYSWATVIATYLDEIERIRRNR